MLCPKDRKPCVDDLCYGSGCMRMSGKPMLEVCGVCGKSIDEESPIDNDCICVDEYDE